MKKTLITAVTVLSILFSGSAVLALPEKLRENPKTAAFTIGKKTQDDDTVMVAEVPNDSLVLPPLVITDPDPKEVKAGQKLFKKKCAMCHDVSKGQKNRMGPPLWDVYGRGIAGAEGYKKYSKAFKDQSGKITWDSFTLYQWLASPKDFVKGNKMMGFRGFERDADRGAVIAYLRTLTKQIKLGMTEM